MYALKLSSVLHDAHQVRRPVLARKSDSKSRVNAQIPRLTRKLTTACLMEYEA